MSHQVIFKRQIITEKSKQAEARHAYTFEVSLNSTKSGIAKTCQELFGIRPLSVRITKIPHKIRSRDHAKKRRQLKKAIITLSPKDKIDITKIK